MISIPVFERSVASKASPGYPKPATKYYHSIATDKTPENG